MPTSSTRSPRRLETRNKHGAVMRRIWAGYTPEVRERKLAMLAEARARLRDSREARKREREVVDAAADVARDPSTRRKGIGGTGRRPVRGSAGPDDGTSSARQGRGRPRVAIDAVLERLASLARQQQALQAALAEFRAEWKRDRDERAGNGEALNREWRENTARHDRAVLAGLEGLRRDVFHVLRDALTVLRDDDPPSTRLESLRAWARRVHAALWSES
jgi:hypothetical protein